MIKLKRAYDPPDKEDGFRVLVDRIWPRGMKKEDLALDLWLKEIAPSSSLRKWFGHDLQRWPEFCQSYEAELKEQGDLIDFLKEISDHGVLILVFSARDAEHNNAVALKKYLESL
ncbi:MAG: hypothetical protein DPW09_36900 [Anaerolineae bacterium]|nr:DUF488 domain-containing protein [Anaerolineae bacterium]MCQ3979034.1 hypothetical protein [Anaerolineae bacterium]